MANYLDESGLSYFWSKIKPRFTGIENQLPSTISGVATNTETGSMELWSADLNNVTTSGLYNAMTCTNAKYPHSTLIVIGYYMDGYCTQIQSDVTTGAIATRTQINGTWSAWKEIDTSVFYTKTETDAITGDLADLTTTEKTNLVAAINEASNTPNITISTAEPSGGSNGDIWFVVGSE